MKFASNSILVFLICAFFSQSCSGGHKDNQANDSAIAKMAGLAFDYTFNDEPHRITYEKANELIKNFRDSIRLAIGNRYFRMNTLEGKTILIDSTFKQVFQKDTGNTHYGIRVHFGLDLTNKKLEYYLSPVQFESQIRPGQNEVDTLVFEPFDTAETSNNFDYLRNVDVYKVADGGKLKEIVYPSDDWQKMSLEWINYKNAYAVGNPRNGRVTVFNSNCTRSIVITNQALYNMIRDNKLNEINIISCANINDTTGELRHSVLFSHSNLTEEEVNLLIKQGTAINILNQYEANWSEDVSNKAIMPKKNIKSYNDLTVNELMFLELQQKITTKKFFGLSADYAQLCPTRCGRLLGSYDSETKLFTIKGFSK